MNLPPPFEERPVNIRNKTVKKAKRLRDEDKIIHETTNIKRAKEEERKPIEIEHKIEKTSIQKPIIQLPSLIEPLTNHKKDINVIQDEQPVSNQVETIKTWRVATDEEIESNRLTLQRNIYYIIFLLLIMLTIFFF